MLNLVHPVGELYLTTNSLFNPNISWGGTWEKLTSDAYFKIVSSNAGQLGGTSSQHKIPIGSMPTHSHTFLSIPTEDTQPWVAPHQVFLYKYVQGTHYTMTTTTSGDGSAYYPYYYGVIAWHRTA